MTRKYLEASGRQLILLIVMSLIFSDCTVLERNSGAAKSQRWTFPDSAVERCGTSVCLYLVLPSSF
jgi:hypothetical protein